MTTKKTTKKTNKATEIISANRTATVRKFIDMLEDKTLDWTKEWGGCSADDPMNPCTGTHYSGANRMLLMFAALDKGDNRFCTMKQANKRGWKVRKGAKSHIVEKYGKVKVYERDDDGNIVRDDDGRPVIKFCYMKPLGYWSVFNFADIDGAPEMPKPAAHTTTEIDAMMDALKETSRCRVDEGVTTNHDADGAYYSPSGDYINVPDRTLFTSLEAALATLTHEMGHSTGHADALNRDGITGFNGFGSDEYAFEELIAELTAVFTTSYLGLSCEMDDIHFRNHAAYLKSWVRRFNDKPDELFKAAGKASKAADYIIERLTADHPEYVRTDEIIPEATADDDATDTTEPAGTPEAPAAPAPAEENDGIIVGTATNGDRVVIATTHVVDLTEAKPEPKPRMTRKERMAAENAKHATIDLLLDFAKLDDRAAVMFGMLCDDINAGLDDAAHDVADNLQDFAKESCHYILRERMPEDIIDATKGWLDGRDDYANDIMALMEPEADEHPDMVYPELASLF